MSEESTEASEQSAENVGGGAVTSEESWVKSEESAGKMEENRDAAERGAEKLGAAQGGDRQMTRQLRSDGLFQ